MGTATPHEQAALRLIPRRPFAVGSHAPAGYMSTEQRAAAVQEVAGALKVNMRRAIAGDVNFVAQAERVNGSDKPRERLIHAVDALVLTLDHMTVFAKLRAALVHSECPHVAALRESVIDGYAQMQAECVAQARGLI
jgi:hypothetical protein